MGIGILLVIGINYAQTNVASIKCNLKALNKLYTNLDSLDINTAREFFLTFSDRCNSKVEYLEWSNELLFQFLQKNPEKFIEALSYGKNYELDNIYKNLESPIHDGIDLNKIFNKVEAIELHSSIKQEILKRIKSALSKTD